MKVRVRIAPIEACISDFVCVAICPEVFVIDERSGKASIKPSYRVGGEVEGIVEGALVDCVSIASENCPVDIIHWEALE